MSSETAYIGLGSNLDDPVGQVRKGLRELRDLPHTQWVASSSLYRTAPIGKSNQPDFINAVAVLTTALSARELLTELQALETGHGRLRGERNGPRTLDLDLLLLGERVIREPGLEVPHPRMHERAFVLLPLQEVNPAAVIPGHGNIAALVVRAADQRVRRIDG